MRSEAYDPSQEEPSIWARNSELHKYTPTSAAIFIYICIPIRLKKTVYTYIQLKYVHNVIIKIRWRLGFLPFCFVIDKVVYRSVAIVAIIKGP